MLHCYHAASSVVESTLFQECVLESSVHLSPVSKARVGLQFMVEVEGDRLGSHPRLFESAKVKSKARDSQESSPTLQFKSINSSVLSFLHNPTLTSIHDHWKNHSLD